MSPGGRTWALWRRDFGAADVRERARHGRFDLDDVERLADVIERAFAHRFDRRFQRSKPTDEQHVSVRVLGLERAQQVESRLRRIEVDVGDHQIDVAASQCLKRTRRLLLGDNSVGSSEEMSSVMKRQVSRSSSTTRIVCMTSSVNWPPRWRARRLCSAGDRL